MTLLESTEKLKESSLSDQLVPVWEKPPEGYRSITMLLSAPCYDRKAVPGTPARKFRVNLAQGITHTGDTVELIQIAEELRDQTGKTYSGEEIITFDDSTALSPEDIRKLEDQVPSFQSCPPLQLLNQKGEDMLQDMSYPVSWWRGERYVVMKGNFHPWEREQPGSPVLLKAKGSIPVYRVFEMGRDSSAPTAFFDLS